MLIERPSGVTRWFISTLCCSIESHYPKSDFFLPGRIFGTGVDSGIFLILDETNEANGLVWKRYFLFQGCCKMQKRTSHTKSTSRGNDWETLTLLLGESFPHKWLLNRSEG